MADDYDLPKGALMAGKKGLVMGVANHQSIAWGIAAQLAAQGASLAFAYMEANEKRVKPLGESIGVKSYVTFDAFQDGSIEAAVGAAAKDLGGLDFLVHSIGFADRSQIGGSFVENATREAFLRAMDASVFSWVDAAKHASRVMGEGGSMITLTYLGSERAIPNYNTMGVCKAALEAATRYIARDLGPRKIRVNSVLPGPVETQGTQAMANFDQFVAHIVPQTPLGRVGQPRDIATVVSFLASHEAGWVTGQVIPAAGGLR